MLCQKEKTKRETEREKEILSVIFRIFNFFNFLKVLSILKFLTNKNFKLILKFY